MRFAIGPVVAPAGMTTVNCVAVAVDTVAAAPLNATVLFAAVALKPLPVIVTVPPADPTSG